LQRVSEKVWGDETHVQGNRKLYQEKSELADKIFKGVPGYCSPEAGFFLWLPVHNGETAAKTLWEKTGVKVLPGKYLGRDYNGKNPGEYYIRVALVAPLEEARSGLTNIKNFLYA
jgi:aspartate/methionine/tyrosine aminotransferase